MIRVRLDIALVQRGLVKTRSQAENYIKLGYVLVGGRPADKPGKFIDSNSGLELMLKEQYVSRAALKLASVAGKLKLNFKNKIVLDVGSSTGGFTDFALRHGAKKVIAVDVGTDQLHPDLRGDIRVELHEQTDVRDLKIKLKPDIILVDVSFISLREILPAVAKFSSKDTEIVAMLKPQFEAGRDMTNKGVVKNDRLRREILKDFELWLRKYFVVNDKADSSVAGTHGNLERFYLLKLSSGRTAGASDSVRAPRDRKTRRGVL